MKKLATFLLGFTLVASACNANACQEESKWKSYFNFDNVTIEQTETTTYSGTNSDGIEMNGTMSDSTTVKIDGVKWEWYSPDGGNFNGVNYNSILLYYDGENRYINGELDESAGESKEVIPDVSQIEMFKYDESSFTETSEGVFFAESIFSVGTNFENVTITVAEEKIQSVCFTYSYLDDGITYITQENYTLSNWGTTTIQAE